MEAVEGGFWAEAMRTAYVTPGTVLRIRREKKKRRESQKEDTTVLGALPAREQYLTVHEGDT